MSKKLLFIDTEIGGLDYGKHSLLQIGMVVYEDGKIIDKAKYSLKYREYTVMPKAMEINKIDLLDCYYGGVTEEELVKKIEEFINKNFDEKPVLAGHNTGSTQQVLKNVFKRNNKNYGDIFNHRVIDTMSFLWVLSMQNIIPESACSTAGALKHFEVKNNKPHDALEDALASVELFEKIVYTLFNKKKILSELMKSLE